MIILRRIAIAAGIVSVAITLTTGMVAVVRDGRQLPLRDLGIAGITMIPPMLMSCIALAGALIDIRQTAALIVALASWACLLLVFGVEGFFRLF